MSNDTSYDLVFCHREKKYLQRVIEHLLEKKNRYEKRPKNIPLDEQLRKLGLPSRADFVSWGFDFGPIESGRFLTRRLGFIEGYGVTATAWANENSSNVHISGEDGELASLLRTFPELDISGSYSDEYSTGSIRGHEKIQEQSREEADAEEAEWGSDDYSEATKTLLNKTYHGPFSLKEARELIARGADLNASMNGTPFGGMLADPGWELYKAIPELLEKGMEMRSISHLHADLARILANKYADLDLAGLYHLDPSVAEILVTEAAKKGMPDGETLYLNLALGEIPDDLARVLVRFPGCLSLEIENLDIGLASILGAHPEKLALGLREMDVKTANILVKKAIEQKRKNLGLILRRLQELPLELAKALASFPGDLVLGINHEITVELASILATHLGRLEFSDFGSNSSQEIVELGEQAAEALGRHKGPLDLPLLRFLSVKEAVGLARNTYGLCLLDLGRWNKEADFYNKLVDAQGNSYCFKLDNQVLAALMQCPGEVMLGIDHLTPEQAEICASHAGVLWLPYLSRMEPEAAKLLAKKSGGLNLSGIKELPDEVCDIISSFKGSLALEGLEKVSLRGQRALKKLIDAPEPTAICAPHLFPPLANLSPMSQTPADALEEKNRLSALLKQQISAAQKGSVPVDAEIQPLEPSAAEIGTESRRTEAPQTEAVSREKLFDMERLREDLRKEIKAEVLREIRSEPKAGSSPIISSYSSSSAESPGTLRNFDTKNESSHRSRSSFRYSWLIFPMGLFLGWVLLKILPDLQLRSNPTSTTAISTTQAPPTPEPPKLGPTVATTPTAVIEPRPEEPSESKPTVHVVTQGDTYWSMVRRYYPESGDFNAEIERLREANPDLDERSLSIGTEVVIPPPQSAESSSSPQSPEERGAEDAERLTGETSEEAASDGLSQDGSNRRKSRLSKPMQMPAWAAPSANEQAYDDDKSF